MNEIQKEENPLILNQHSALTTFQLKEGKYYPINVEKINFSILEKMQKILIKEFKDVYLSTYNQLGLKSNEIKSLTDNTFKNKELTIAEDKINIKALTKLAIEIKEYKEKQINKVNTNDKEKNKLLKDLKETALTKLANDQMQVLVTQQEINEILIDIKEYCKEKAIKQCVEETTIDFTMLANKLETNSTVLKKQLKNSMGTVLEFNYIDRKNLNIDITSNLIASVKFTHDKKNNRTWMTFQIPQEILRLLLMPEIYVPIANIAVNKIEGKFTYRLHGLFEDHIKRGVVELSKEELFNFLTLPKSYSNRKNLVEYVLDPTIEDIKRVSGMIVTYDFLPDFAWEKIRFNLKRGKGVKKDNIPILTKDEKISVEKNDLILNEIKKAKKNLYVSQAWNKRVDNKIIRIYRNEDEKYVAYILRSIYKNLKTPVKTTLVQYINGIIKKLDRKEIEKVIFTQNIHIEEAEVLDENKKSEDNIQDDFIYNMFLEMNETSKENIEKKAKELYLIDTGTEEITGIHESIFERAKKNLIVNVLKQQFSG